MLGFLRKCWDIFTTCVSWVIGIIITASILTWSLLVAVCIFLFNNPWLIIYTLAVLGVGYWIWG